MSTSLDQSSHPNGGAQYYTSELATRWLAYRVDLIGSLVALCTSLFVLYKHDMDAALAGFVLSYSVTFVRDLPQQYHAV